MVVMVLRRRSSSKLSISFPLPGPWEIHESLRRHSHPRRSNWHRVHSVRGKRCSDCEGWVGKDDGIRWDDYSMPDRRCGSFKYFLAIVALFETRSGIFWSLTMIGDGGSAGETSHRFWGLGPSPFILRPLFLQCSLPIKESSVDGTGYILLMEEILNQLRLIVYPIVYEVSYIPGGCLGFLPSACLHKKLIFPIADLSDPQLLSKPLPNVHVSWSDHWRIGNIRLGHVLYEMVWNLVERLTGAIVCTPWKINMEPENTPLEEEKHLPNQHFQVLS